MIYGYIRVSSRDQNVERQIAAMEKAGVPDENLYIDKQSGKNFHRTQYGHMLKNMRGGDVLFVESIDRLGRNYGDILCQWQLLTKDMGVDIVVLDMPLLDTRRGKDLMGTFLSDVVLQILSFVAENERVSIRQRQAEGIAAAQQRGVRFGRPSEPLPENFYVTYQRWKNGAFSATVAAQICGMALSSFLYRVRRYEADLEQDLPLLEEDLLEEDLLEEELMEELERQEKKRGRKKGEQGGSVTAAAGRCPDPPKGATLWNPARGAASGLRQRGAAPLETHLVLQDSAAHLTKTGSMDIIKVQKARSRLEK